MSAAQRVAPRRSVVGAGLSLHSTTAPGLSPRRRRPHDRLDRPAAAASSVRTAPAPRDEPVSDTPLRVHRRTGYVHVPNDVALDDRLSYRALGLLLFMLSRPDGWAYSRDRLCRGPELDGAEGRPRIRGGREGREAVASALRELTAAGYYRAVRQQVERGRYVMVTEVTDTPGSWS